MECNVGIKQVLKEQFKTPEKLSVKAGFIVIIRIRQIGISGVKL